MKSRGSAGPRNGRPAGSSGAPALAGILALGIVLGCGPAAGSPSVGATPTARPTPSASLTPTAASSATPTAGQTPPIVHATGSADLVLRVASGGGLLPMEMRLAELPTISVYGDGRVIREGETGAAPTDPLVPELLESRLTPEAMTAVLAAAGDAGLLGPDRRLALEGVYDLWSVAFVLIANGATHRTWAYALGFSDEGKFAPPEDLPARKALNAFFERLRDLPGWLGQTGVSSDAPYRPRQVRLYVAPVWDWSKAPDASPATATARPGQDIRDWPLQGPPDVFGEPIDSQEGSWRCGLLGAEDAGRWGIASATNDTRWRAGDRLYRVVIRPLLPDEAGCRD